MSSKKIKDILKAEANKIVITDRSQEILEKYQPVKAPVVKETTPKKKWWNLSLGLGLSLVVGIVVLFLILNLNRPNSPVGPTPQPGNPTMTKAKSVIGQEIMLAGSLTEGEEVIQQPMALRANVNYDDIYLIHDYLLTGEMLLNKTNVEMTIELNTNDMYSEYTYFMKVTYLDSNDEESYDFYYNEYPQEDGRDNDEVSIDFSGIMIFSSYQLKVEGTRENEENEEFTTITKLFKDDNLFLKIEQETEVNENEYKYTYYENNRVTRTVEQEVEYENNKKEMSITVEENNVEREFNYTYYNDHILCEYELESGNIESEIEVLIYEYDTYYLYVIDEKEIKISKNANKNSLSFVYRV